MSKTLRPVRKQDLQPGDVIVASGVHAVLFGGWANKERTKYICYEQSASRGSVRRVTPYPYWKGAGRYAAKRHPGVREGSSPTVSRGGARQWPPARMKRTLKQSDFNGDGRSDISFLYDGVGDKRSLWRFYSTTKGYRPINVWMSNPGAFDVGSAKKTSGDFNGDNIADSAFLYQNPDKSSSVWIFYSNKGRSVKTVKAWTSAPGFFNWDRVKMASGDFNGDGRSDLAFFDGSAGDRSCVWVFLTKKDGTFQAAGNKWWQGLPGAFDWERAKMAPGDYNGDGRTDLAFLYNYASTPTTLWIFTAQKSGHFVPKVWWKANPGTFKAERIKMLSGYFNADDLSDIAVFYDESNNTSSVIILYVGKGGSFSPKRKWLSAKGGFGWNRAKVMSGDYNADGLSDLAFFYGYLNGQTKAWMFQNNSDKGFVPRPWWANTAGTYIWDNAMAIDQQLTQDMQSAR